MHKIKVVIKRPDEEFGHMTNISPSLENLQKTVGGHFETVTLLSASEIITSPVIALVNEEGKIKGLERNMRIPGDILVGTIIVCGVQGEDIGDIPIEFKLWKKLVKILEENSKF